MTGRSVWTGVCAASGLWWAACTPIALDDLSPQPSASPEPTPPVVTPTATSIPPPTATPTPTPTPVPVDRDDDGFNSDVDCNDRNPNAHPGAVELCDGVDNNCDGVTDEDLPQVSSWPDLDGDGYGNSNIPSESCSVPSTNVQQPGDCDDDDPEVNPDQVEICNGKDDDCNDEIDEIAEFFWADVDEDGFGDDSLEPERVCDPSSGYADQAGDCNDIDAAVNPDQVEVCNGKDDDCNEGIDELSEYYWPDVDDDGFGDEAAQSELLCDPGVGYVQNPYDCDDLDAARAPVLVSTRGTSNGDGSFENPFSRIGPALSVPNGCLRVLLEPGTYSEAINTTPLDGLQLLGLSSTEDTVLTAPSGQSPLTLTDVRNMTVEGFAIQGAGEVGQAGACVRIEDSANVTFRGMIIRGCTAGGQFNGGGMAVLDSSTVLIEDSTFLQNKAQNGGALFADTSSVALRAVRCKSNSARTSGGAIFVDSSSQNWASATVLIDHSILEDNLAQDSGGAASANENTGLSAGLEAVDSHFYRNSTLDRFGGAINNPTRVLRSTFIQNTCKGSGSFADGGALTLRQSADVFNSIFIANDAQYAGAINLYELTTSTSGDSIHRLYHNTFVDHNARALTTPGDTFHAYNGDVLEFINNLIVNMNGLNSISFFVLDIMEYDVDYTYFALDSGDPFGGLNWDENVDYYLELNPGVVPIFKSYLPGQYYSADLHLADGCPAINGGDSSSGMDPDGSLPDVGAYGGPDAAGWD